MEDLQEEEGTFFPYPIASFGPHNKPKGPLIFFLIFVLCLIFLAVKHF
jgi:hypothetical protein